MEAGEVVEHARRQAGKGIVAKIQKREVPEMVKYTRWQTSEFVPIQVQLFDVSKPVKHAGWQAGQARIAAHEQVCEVDQVIENL